MNAKFKGVYTALATPYKNDALDTASYKRLIELQIESGIDGIVCLGTTGEPHFLSERERKTVLKTAASAAKGKVPFIVGVGAQSTSEAVRLSREAALLGADGILVAPPYYSKCTSLGYVKHIEAVCEAVKLPVILYNIPSRAGFSLDIASVAECFCFPSVCAIKDADDGGGYTDALLEIGDVFCGTDGAISAYISKGAIGAISVLSNVCPCFTKKCFYGRDASALKVFEEFSDLIFKQVSPIGIKYCLSKSGIFSSNEMRLPLTEISAENAAAIDMFTAAHPEVKQ